MLRETRAICVLMAVEKCPDVPNVTETIPCHDGRECLIVLGGNRIWHVRVIPQRSTLPRRHWGAKTLCGGRLEQVRAAAFVMLTTLILSSVLFDVASILWSTLRPSCGHRVSIRNARGVGHFHGIPFDPSQHSPTFVHGKANQDSLDTGSGDVLASSDHVSHHLKGFSSSNHTAHRIPSLDITLIPIVALPNSQK